MFSPLGRDQFGQRYQREFLVFYKKRRNQRRSTLSLLWLLIGLYLEATAVSIIVFRASPLIGTFKGMIAGIRQLFFHSMPND